jgi:hypothetical protein
VRILRSRYTLLLIWTGACLLPAPALLSTIAAPVAARCFEWCDLDRMLAMAAIVIIGTVWLVVTLLALWLSTRALPLERRSGERRRFAAFAALASAALPLVLSLVSVTSGRGIALFLVFLFFALQVIAGYALAAGARFSPVRWAALWLMVLATLTISPLVRADNVFINTLALSAYGFVGFDVGLALLAATAWPDHVGERPGLLLLIASSLLSLAATVYSVRFHQSIGVGALAGIALAIGWLWIGIVSLRSRFKPSAAEPSSAGT